MSFIRHTYESIYQELTDDARKTTEYIAKCAEVKKAIEEEIKDLPPLQALEKIKKLQNLSPQNNIDKDFQDRLLLGARQTYSESDFMKKEMKIAGQPTKMIKINKTELAYQDTITKIIADRNQQLIDQEKQRLKKHIIEPKRMSREELDKLRIPPDIDPQAQSAFCVRKFYDPELEKTIMEKLGEGVKIEFVYPSTSLLDKFKAMILGPDYNVTTSLSKEGNTLLVSGTEMCVKAVREYVDQNIEKTTTARQNISPQSG